MKTKILNPVPIDVVLDAISRVLIEQRGKEFELEILERDTHRDTHEITMTLTISSPLDDTPISDKF